MKFSIIIIFSIIFGIYIGANFYVYIRGWEALPKMIWLRNVYFITFVLFACGYLGSKIFEKTAMIGTHHVFYWMGAFWFAALLYFFLGVILIDLARLSNWVFHFLPGKESVSYASLKIGVFVAVVLGVSCVLAYGHWNARRPKVKHLELFVDKKAGERKELTVAMVSDIHLGTLLGKEKVKKMVDSVNALHPDLILLAGDILDEVQTPIFRNDVGGPIRELRAPLGVYGIPGNHEYIGGISRSLAYLETLNVTILRDTALLIDRAFYLAGRDDRDMSRFAGRSRMTLKEVLSGIDRQFPVILLDHQPFRLEDAENNGVDLQLSGHTHHGQFWPFQYITNKVYEVSWGYKKRGNTHYYVSCGYGYWGPPVRIGNTPEIVFVKLKFRE